MYRFVRRDPMANLGAVTKAAGKPQAVDVTMTVRPALITGRAIIAIIPMRNASDDQAGSDP
ncbi:hypothetical protein [Catenulispora subtropica]|uniref:Uncharacterized protein n=1 Tax=Catenulispora subtropica TaxID=450798 RepID=A0ABN2QRW2_9ACTN